MQEMSQLTPPDMMELTQVTGDFQREELGKSWKISEYLGQLRISTCCHLPKFVEGTRFSDIQRSKLFGWSTLWVKVAVWQRLFSGSVLVQCGTRRITSTASDAGASQDAHNVMPRVSLIFLAKRLDV